MPDFMRDDTPLDLSSLAPGEKLQKVTEMATEYATIVNEIDRLQKEVLPELSKRRQELERRILPTLFDEIGTDHIGVPSQNCDVVVKPYYHANIRSDWPEEQREAAFSHLIDVELESLIAVEVTVKFARGEYEDAAELVQIIKDSRFGNTHVPKMEMGVPWNTLTAAVKKEIEDGRGADLDLEKLGATVGTTAAIKKRKVK